MLAGAHNTEYVRMTVKNRNLINILFLYTIQIEQMPPYYSKWADLGKRPRLYLYFIRKMHQAYAPAETRKSRPVPAFIRKTYSLLSNPKNASIVHWTASGTSFVIIDMHRFAHSVLPEYFKHDRIPSFVRQLNMYGFRKLKSQGEVFMCSLFIRGELELLKSIRRKPEKKNKENSRNMCSLKQMDLGTELNPKSEKSQAPQLCFEQKSTRFSSNMLQTVHIIEKQRRKQGTIISIAGMEEDQNEGLNSIPLKEIMGVSRRSMFPVPFASLGSFLGSGLNL